MIDGDTIVVKMDDQEFHLRYIGVDAPENGETYQSNSTAVNVDLVLGKTVYLVKDQNDTDSFGRLLRYVLVGDTFVNYEMINQGAAWAGSWPPDTACYQTFNEAQISARTSLLGLWAIPPTAVVLAPPATPDTSNNIVPFVPLIPTEEPVPTEPPAGNCDPAYPGVCIPPAPPDLDCGDIPFRRFQVLSPDPHNFDGDGNGIGCESG